MIRCAVALPQANLVGRLEVLTSFSGQRLLFTRPSRCYPLSNLRMGTTVVSAHQQSHGSASSINHSLSGTDHILDDLSRYIYYQLRGVIAPHVPPGFDALGWLPESIHRRVHKGELGCTVFQDRGIRTAAIVALINPFFQAYHHPYNSSIHDETSNSQNIASLTAIILLREVLHFSLFYFLLSRVEAMCRRLYRLYVTNTQANKEITKQSYEASAFRAMANPLRLLIVVWAGTRLAHISAPLLNFHIELGLTAKTRSIGLVVAVAWFCFQWKRLYVSKLVSTNKIDAPRILAFDKVVSLLMYYVAAACIGDVTGFGLRSLLTVGGFSGVALGLAAKEIVSNFFGGAVLFVTRPFVIGERIKTGHFSGYVQDIGFLQTKILSFDEVPMIVPNQSFINQVITNYSRAMNKSMEAEFQLRIQDIFLVDRITARVVKYLRGLPDVDANKSAPLCYLQSLGANDITLAVKCVLRPLGGPEFYKLQQSILVHIAEIITIEGAGIGHNAPFSSAITGLTTDEVLGPN